MITIMIKIMIITMIIIMITTVAMIMVMIVIIVIVLIIIFYLKKFFSPMLSYVCLTFAHIKLLHISMNIAVQVAIQTILMSSFKHSPWIVLTPANIFQIVTSISSHEDFQSSFFLHSIFLNHPNLSYLNYHLSYGPNTQTAAQFLTWSWLVCFSWYWRYNVRTGW